MPNISVPRSSNKHNQICQINYLRNVQIILHQSKIKFFNKNIAIDFIQRSAKTADNPFNITRNNFGQSYGNSALEQSFLYFYNFTMYIDHLRRYYYYPFSASTAPGVSTAMICANNNNAIKTINNNMANPSFTSISNTTMLSRNKSYVNRNAEIYPYLSIDQFALSMPFPQQVLNSEEQKPQQSYIGLIAMAILNSIDKKLVLSDIYQHILDNYPYFRARGPGWRNSIRHNLSLNDCFIKSGRSANGKGHYWSIHPANIDDFCKGDFRRRKAQRKVRKHMGLSVEEESIDSLSSPPFGLLTPTTRALQTPFSTDYAKKLSKDHIYPNNITFSATNQNILSQHETVYTEILSPFRYILNSQISNTNNACFTTQLYDKNSTILSSQKKFENMINDSLLGNSEHCKALEAVDEKVMTLRTRSNPLFKFQNIYSKTPKRQFDVASLLEPDSKFKTANESFGWNINWEPCKTSCLQENKLVSKVTVGNSSQSTIFKNVLEIETDSTDQEDIDVVANDAENYNDYRDRMNTGLINELNDFKWKTQNINNIFLKQTTSSVTNNFHSVNTHSTTFPDINNSQAILSFGSTQPDKILPPPNIINTIIDRTTLTALISKNHTKNKPI